MVFARKLLLSSVFSILVILVLFGLASGSVLLFANGIDIREIDLRAIDWRAIDWRAVPDQAYQFVIDTPQIMVLVYPLALAAIFSLVMILMLVHRQVRLIEQTKEVLMLRRRSGDYTADMDNVIRMSEDQIDAETIEDKPQQSSKSGWSNPASSALVERLKKDLVIAEQQLESANKSKAQFLANMSHELRTPMNGILGMTELLLGSGLNEKQLRFSESVRRSAESLLAIINDLLDYSKMESGALSLENAAFNFREVVEDVCELHAELAQRKGLELICHIERSMQDSVIGDSNRVRQILTNLVGNAIKFTKQGEVVVRVKQLVNPGSENSYQIDVVDTGIGITPEGQASIFESFTQADSSNIREFGGAGLGLFITHSLVNKMGGKISLRSRMDEGSHFTVELNIRSGGNTQNKAGFRGMLCGAKVLIVDDNETNRTILYHQLKSWGAEPLPVESASRAMEALENAHKSESDFDVAVLDLHMPGKDGIELAKDMQADPRFRDLKRMMLTSAAMELSAAELADIGVTQHISKPARQTQLYNALATLIPHKASHENNEEFQQQERVFEPLSAHVLLAEDNLINQDVASNMLQNFGCTVEVVGNGRAALDACRLTEFDVILMDCKMSVMDGLEATRRLRKNAGKNQSTTVLALTAHVLEGDREKCIDSGMNGFIGKPVKQEDLYRVLLEHIGHKKTLMFDSPNGVRALAKETSPAANNEKFDNSPDKSAQASAPEESKTGDVSTAATEDSQDSASVSESSNTPARNLKVVAVENTSAKGVASNEPVGTGDTADSDVNLQAIENIRKLQRPGKPDIVKKVIKVYFDKSPALVQDIVKGFAAGDLKQVKEAAHSLKSSSAYVGADNISERCKRIEVAAHNGSLEEVQEIVDSLEADYSAIAENLLPFVEDAA
ncbi:MAG: response regulator [Granulosicoccus sp.]|nr:response regulator [Granulosicoccus sp.]